VKRIIGQIDFGGVVYTVVGFIPINVFGMQLMVQLVTF